MADDIDLSKIEVAVLEWIRVNWPQGVPAIAEFDITSDVSTIPTPGVHVAAECTGFVKIGKGSIKYWSKQVLIHCILVFKSLAGQSGRRSGAHPIVSAIEQLCRGQNLGLGIAPLEPVRSPEVTDEELRSAARIGFDCQFRTSYDVKTVSLEEAQALLEIGVNYYLKPGDEVADAQDTIDIEQ